MLHKKYLKNVYLKIAVNKNSNNVQFYIVYATATVTDIKYKHYRKSVVTNDSCNKNDIQHPTVHSKTYSTMFS